MLRLFILPLLLLASVDAFVEAIVPGGGAGSGGSSCGCCNGLFGGITGSSPIPMPKDCQEIKDVGGGRDGIYTIFPTEIAGCFGVKVWCDQARDGGGWTNMPKDCQDIKDIGGGKTGIYTIFPTYNGACGGVKVWCDQSNDGGGWTVFQRRTDGRLDFFRGWEEYRNGFGKLSQEHWLGNELIYNLLMQDRYELRVELQDFQFNEVHARYFRFAMGDEFTNYTLAVGGYDPSSDAGDALSGHNGQPFSTFDRDNDRWTKNCAEEYGGAWWYTSCHNSNLNGLYLRGPTREYARGVVWNQWRGYSYSLKRTEMKFRPRV